MKTARLILFGAVISSFLSTAQAQYNPRRLTRRIAPQMAQTNAAPAQAAPQQAPPPAPAPAVSTNPPPRPVVHTPPPIDPEKAKAAREEAARKAVEFQKKRAEEGSESAQYELGVRYLKGDGVVKDEATGRKWLAQSAKNGYGPATRKLEELDKPDQPPPAAKATTTSTPADK